MKPVIYPKDIQVQNMALNVLCAAEAGMNTRFLFLQETVILMTRMKPTTFLDSELQPA